MTDKIPEEYKKMLIGKIPAGDLGSGDDVSNCYVFSQIWPIILTEKPFM